MTSLQSGSGHLRATLACFFRRSGTGGSRHSAKSSSSTTTSTATTSAQRPIATFLPSLRNQAGNPKKQPSPTASTGDRTIWCIPWSCLLLPGHTFPSPNTLPSLPVYPCLSCDTGTTHEAVYHITSSSLGHCRAANTQRAATLFLQMLTSFTFTTLHLFNQELSPQQPAHLLFAVAVVWQNNSRTPGG